MKKISTKEIIKIFQDNDLILTESVYGNSKTKLKCRDKNGYYFITSMEYLKSKWLPTIVSKHNPYTIDNIKNFIKLNDLTCRLVSDKYIGTRYKLKFKCKCGNIFEVSWFHFAYSNQNRCTKCAINEFIKRDRLPVNEVENVARKHKCEIIWDKKYIGVEQNLTLKDYKGYLYSLPIHRLKRIKTLEQISKSNPYSIQNIKTYIKEMKFNCKLLSDKYINSKKKLIFQCECGETFTTSWIGLSVNNVTRCRKCSKTLSSYEMQTKNWLQQNKINFIAQYKFGNCKNKRLLSFDFYLPKNNAVIECNGSQHYFSNDLFGSNLTSQQTNDNIKKQYCEKNKILFIELPYWVYNKKQDFINILRHKLQNKT